MLVVRAVRRPGAAAMAGILFEDIFDVKDIDPEGKKFDRGEWGPATPRLRPPAQSCVRP